MLEISDSILTNARNENLGLDYFFIGMLFSFIIACKFLVNLVVDQSLNFFIFCKCFRFIFTIAQHEQSMSPQ